MMNEQTVMQIADLAHAMLMKAAAEEHDLSDDEAACIDCLLDVLEVEMTARGTPEHGDAACSL